MSECPRNHLLVFGLGYTATWVARRLLGQDWRVTGTNRRAAAEAHTHDAVEENRHGNAVLRAVFDGTAPARDLASCWRDVTHLLISIPPDEDGDPVLRLHESDVANAPRLKWIGYLSTTGVYGDRQGAWVDETTRPSPTSRRSRARYQAEQQWQAYADSHDTTLQIFRLGGIYGPGRSPFERLREGTARRIRKPGQVFNRIHVRDIAGIICAGIAAPEMTGVFNVTDTLPAASSDVIAFAAGLIGVEPPPEIPFETANLSPMARNFYSENKRVRSTRVAADLGYTLRYPTYREGLKAVLGEPSDRME